MLIPRKTKSLPSGAITPDDFNDHFASIGQKVANECNTKAHDFKWPYQTSIHCFKFNAIAARDVTKGLCALKEDSSNDVLNFDTKLLHITASIISNSLTHLFNLSLATCFVPLDWKLARVTPAYTDKDDLQDKTNYRPLSMVLHLAKVFERQLQTQLTGDLSKHEFISIDQSAYIKHHSTQTSLHRLIDDMI